MSIPPSHTYKKIIEGLNQGERIAYDTKDETFVHYNKKAIKNLVKTDPERFITDLAKLKNKVQEFIEKNKLGEQETQALKEAFQNRSSKLESRTILFGRAKFKKAVKDFEAFQKLNPTEQTAQRVDRGRENVFPSPEKPKEGREAERKPSGAPPKGKQKEEAPPPPSPEVEAPQGGPAPPPPPPPPQETSKYTFFHRKLFENLANKKRFKGEPEPPKLKSEDHDFGKIHETIKNKEDRSAYSSAIRTYIEGLNKTLKRVQEEVKEHTDLKDQISGEKEKLRNCRVTRSAKEARSKELRQCLQENKVGKGHKKTQSGYVEVRFFPEAQIEMTRKALGNEPDTEKDFESQGITLDRIRSLEWKIIDLENEDRALTNEIAGYESTIKNLESKREEIEKKEENGIKFTEWEQLISEKSRLRDSWKSALTTFEGGVTAKPTDVEKKSEKKAALESKLARPEFAPLQALYNMREETPFGLQPQLQKFPDDYYRETE